MTAAWMHATRRLRPSYPFAAKPVFVDCAWPSSSTVFGSSSRPDLQASRYQPLFLSPAAMPLMVRWMPRATRSSVSPPR